MAELPSPFDPNGMSSTQQGPGLVDRWKSFLTDPNNAATIMSFGASLAAPMGFGATRAGHISQALGHAGKTASNRAEMERKDLETDSRVQKREADADAATRRAQVAEANSNTAAVRAQAAVQSAGFNDELRRQRAITEQSRRGELEARTRFLETRAALFPEDQEIRNELRRTQMELNQARTVDISANADVRQQNADTRTQDSLTRQRSSERRDALTAESITSREREGQANRQSRESVAAGRQAVSDRQNYDRYVADPLRSGPALPFEEWKKSRGGGAGASPAPQAPAPSPAPSRPQPPATQRANVPQAAIDALIRDPSLATQFDAKYGKGMAIHYINQGL